MVISSADDSWVLMVDAGVAASTWDYDDDQLRGRTFNVEMRGRGVKFESSDGEGCLVYDSWMSDMTALKAEITNPDGVTALPTLDGPVLAALATFLKYQSGGKGRLPGRHIEEWESEFAAKLSPKHCALLLLAAQSYQLEHLSDMLASQLVNYTSGTSAELNETFKIAADFLPPTDLDIPLETSSMPE
jgi:hypothetical protein